MFGNSKDKVRDKRFYKASKACEESERAQYKEKESRHFGESREVKTRDCNLHLHWRISDFEDDEYYGFCGDFEQKKDNGQSDFQAEVGSGEFTILTYGGIRRNGKKRMQIWKKRRRSLSSKLD